MIVASAVTDALILICVGGLFVAVGVGVLWPWIAFRKALTDIRANWIEVDAEIVAYTPVPASDWPQWVPTYAFEPKPGRRIKGKATYQKTLNDKGVSGTRCTVRYNPKDAREFVAANISGRWSELFWGAPFLLSGLVLWIAPLVL